MRVAPERVYVALRQLYDHSALYNQSGGVHTSILLDPASPADPESGVLAVGEDIGRHNTLDKLRGEALLREIDPRGAMIVASGRISSEMLVKAALMGVPIVGSRTSPTQLAVTLAERLGTDRDRVYSVREHERLHLPGARPGRSARVTGRGAFRLADPAP